MVYLCFHKQEANIVTHTMKYHGLSHQSIKNAHLIQSTENRNPPEVKQIKLPYNLNI